MTWKLNCTNEIILPFPQKGRMTEQVHHNVAMKNLCWSNNDFDKLINKFQKSIAKSLLTFRH